MNSGNTEKKSWWSSFTSSSGPHGLQNQGSTCYLNCVLQVLFMTKDFREAVERLCCENHNCENLNRVEKFDFHLQRLFDELKTRKAYTNRITRELGINNVHEQRDAAEYLEKILSRTSPDASKIFCGQLRHRNTCHQCQTPVDEDGPSAGSMPLADLSFTCPTVSQ
ncbi:ubiquitin carboxyl-terminal hydrolase 38 [Myripristis murdjan]|uniref:ubiquitin carboxyl-terminal hydrolase 38 n=1 Tax=Myripristis murdjan TaxID=586833 RepID=UPI001175F94C|nr:ubiquitin carboxyl-terminal hydrolase 38-like [Myripristis murdjan]